MNTAALSALAAWVGGAISWFIAAAFDYHDRAHAFSQIRTRLEIEAKHDPQKAKEYGNIDEAAANTFGFKPSFRESLLATYAQPLFVSSFTGAFAFFGGPRNRELGIPLLIWIIVTGANLIITILNTRALDTSKALRKWYVVSFIWIVGLAASIYSAWAASIVSADAPTADRPAQSLTQQ